MGGASLESIAKALVAPGKGILAADESTGTIGKRFKSINVENTVENRQHYRDMLFTAPGIGEYISGVILYDETLRQKALDGRTFVEVLRQAGVISGIKVDAGTTNLAGSAEEKITEGLDGLRARLEEYKKLGAQFAKWRGVIAIREGNKALPTDYCLRTNAHALARYAALCQDVGIVPIVEPEVLMDGTHSFETCYSVTERTLNYVFAELRKQHVKLDGMLLKPNMIVSGLECSKQASAVEVAKATLDCFNRVVPSAVPGIVFLSGGQSEADATHHLDQMNKLTSVKRPWELSFSYGRALQAAALKAWSGKMEQKIAGQQAFLLRSKLNSAARFGKYTTTMEKEK